MLRLLFSFSGRISRAQYWQEAIGHFPPFASFCIVFCECEPHANVYGPPPEDRPR